MITKKPGLCSHWADLIDRMFSWLWEDVLCMLRNHWETFPLSNLVFERVSSFVGVGVGVFVFFKYDCFLKKSRDGSIAKEISLGLHNVQAGLMLCPSCISGNTSCAKHNIFSHVQHTYLCLMRMHANFVLQLGTRHS